MDKTIESIISPWQNDVAEVRNWNNTIFGIILIGISIAIIAFPMLDNAGTNIIYCLVGGITLLGIGTYLIVAHGNHLVYLPTQSAIKVQHQYINFSEWGKNKNNVDPSQPIPFDGEGMIRIDKLTSADGQFSVCAISQFVEFDYKILHTHRVK